MGRHGSWDDRGWEAGEGSSDWERRRREQHMGRGSEGAWREGGEDLRRHGADPWREGEDLGRGGGDPWRGSDEWRGGREWRGSDAGERFSTGRDPGRDRDRWGGARGRDEWRSGQDRSRWEPGAQERYGGYGVEHDYGRRDFMDRERDWRSEQRGSEARWAHDPGREGRGTLQREDRGPLQWLGDKVRETMGKPRGPKGYKRSDERIREDVCERLARSGLDTEDVEVKVESCEVTLTGSVRSREDKRRIEDVADDVFGVEEVHNHLRLARDTGATSSVEEPHLRH